MSTKSVKDTINDQFLLSNWHNTNWHREFKNKNTSGLKSIVSCVSCTKIVVDINF